MTILGRRKRTFPDDKQDEIDLRDTDLSGADLKDAQFSSVDFTRCTLRRGYFSNCSFRYARLVSVGATGARFSAPRFTRANFTDANLTSVEFHELAETRSTIPGENDREASEGIFDRTNFLRANLTNTLFKVKDMTTCNGLTRDQLSKAIFSEETKLPLGKLNCEN